MLVDLRVPEGAERKIEHSTLRIERRVADMIRTVAVLEKRGKSLTSMLERMLRAYCEKEHPELTLVYEDRP